jgi:hypothetical protein
METEAYQSVPSARALVLADDIAHLILLLEAANSRDAVEGLPRCSMLVRHLFLLFFFFLPFPLGVL